MLSESHREIAFDNGVEFGEEFAHAVGESDHEEFYLLFESFGEVPL